MERGLNYQLSNLDMTRLTVICCNYAVKNLRWNIPLLFLGTITHGRPSNIWALPNSCWQLSPVIKACVHCRAFSSRPGMTHHSGYWTWISGSLKTTNKIRRMWPRMTSALEVCVRASVKGVWVEGREYLSVCSSAWRGQAGPLAKHAFAPL